MEGIILRLVYSVMIREQIMIIFRSEWKTVKNIKQFCNLFQKAASEMHVAPWI